MTTWQLYFYIINIKKTEANDLKGYIIGWFLLPNTTTGLPLTTEAPLILTSINRSPILQIKIFPDQVLVLELSTFEALSRGDKNKQIKTTKTRTIEPNLYLFL